jgi:hypothetical protein
MSTRTVFVALGAAALLTGCYTTTLRSGRAPAPAPTVEYDEKWHSGLVLGIAELSGPYKLNEACPQGWAEIRTETSFINGFVQLVTSGIYNPQTVTIVCAAGPGPAPTAAAPWAAPAAPPQPAPAAPPPAPSPPPASVPAPPPHSPGGAVYAPEPPPAQ